ncbi:nucleotidyltransferase family protein [Gammaproteobacteria bacterium]|nr:nucleotidyltransferase family protein [Gammaproteobacteria bacterium]
MSVSEVLWKETLLSIDSTIKDAIKCLDKTGLKIVLVIDKNNNFKGTISDGDIRRGLLNDMNLESKIDRILHKDALVVPDGLELDLIKSLMNSNKIFQIPIISDEQQVIGLHYWGEISTVSERQNYMIVMAGGMGKRLMPHTEHCPKPLVEVAGKPMLEHIIEQAKIDGFKNFIFSINYLGHMIEEHFGDGSRFGISIEYIKENEPLGTAGSISLIKNKINRAAVVTNGDVITDIHYGEILDFHEKHQAKATMAVKVYEQQNPFGVVETQGLEIISLKEKPITTDYINAGVYVISPSAVKKLETGSYCDMPDLFRKIIDDNEMTIVYPMHEPWVDVGRPADLENFK